MKCSACGTPATMGATFCAKCGNKLSDREAATVLMTSQAPSSAAGRTGASAARSRTTAALLALLLGWVGGHKFYVGKVGQGVLYLLFFWTLIPFVVGVIEAVIYLSMSDEAFAKKYGGTSGQRGQPVGVSVGAAGSKESSAAGARPSQVRRPFVYAAGCLGVIVVLGLISALVGGLAPESSRPPASQVSAAPPAAPQAPKPDPRKQAKVAEESRPAGGEPAAAIAAETESTVTDGAAESAANAHEPDAEVVIKPGLLSGQRSPWTIKGNVAYLDFTLGLAEVGNVNASLALANELYRLGRERRASHAAEARVNMYAPPGSLTNKYGKGNPEPVYLGGFSIDLEEVRKYQDDWAFRASDYWEGIYRAALELAGHGNLYEK